MRFLTIPIAIVYIWKVLFIEFIKQNILRIFFIDIDFHSENIYILKLDFYVNIFIYRDLDI